MVQENKSTLTKMMAIGGLLMVSTVAVGLSGCGGGNDGGGPSPNPTSTPGGGGGGTDGTPPVLQPLPTETPLTPQQAADAFEEATGVTTDIVPFVAGEPVQQVVRNQTGTPSGERITEIASTVNRIINVDNLVIPIFGTLPFVAQDSNPRNNIPRSVTLRTAGELLFSPADIQRYRQTIISNRLIAVGDRLLGLRFRQGNRTFLTPLITSELGRIKYNPVFFATPNRETRVDRAVGTGFVTGGVSRHANINPIDGHLHYIFTLNSDLKFDRQTGDVRVTSSRTSTVLGPFVRLLDGPTKVAVTNTTDDGTGLTALDPKKCQDSSSQAEFAYDNKQNSTRTSQNSQADDSWRKRENNRLKVCGKRNTAAAAARGNRF